MEIKWIAHACFHIILEDQTSLVFDPFQGIGYEIPAIQADLVFVSHQHADHNAVEKLKGNFKVFDRPGFYQEKGVEIEGITSFHDKEKGKRRGTNTIFKVSAEGLTLVHLGDLGYIPGEDIFEKLRGVDVLFIPVGGVYTIDAKEAFEICKILEPNLIIPMHYRTPGLLVKIGPLQDFIDATGEYFDRSSQRKNKIVYSVEKKKKRPRIILLENSF